MEYYGDYLKTAINVVHYSFLESNRSITTEIYNQKLGKMHVQLSKMRSALVNR